MPYRDLRTSPNARWIALVVVCLAQLMSIVDASIVNVALPNIQHSLRFSPSSLTWVVNGYLISFGSFLLLAGRLGDLVGRRRMFLAGVALFTVASAVCGLSDDQTLLIAARFIQGLGGAGATSAIMAIIVTEFRLAAERAKAMSIYMGVVSSGGSIGLLAGGSSPRCSTGTGSSSSTFRSVSPPSCSGGCGSPRTRGWASVATSTSSVPSW